MCNLSNELSLIDKLKWIAPSPTEKGFIEPGLGVSHSCLTVDDNKNVSLVQKFAAESGNDKRDQVWTIGRKEKGWYKIKIYNKNYLTCTEEGNLIVEDLLPDVPVPGKKSTVYSGNSELGFVTNFVY